MKKIQQTEDQYFFEVAKSLGYRPQDLQPVERDRIERQASGILRGMSEIERKYYIKKKQEALEKRRQKIIDQIVTEKRKILYKHQSKEKQNFNPVVLKLLQQHEVLCNKKTRYLEKVAIKKKQNDRYKMINKTIDLGRTTPHLSLSNSKISKRSVKSSSSHSSISHNSHKSKVNLIKKKQKEMERQKKSEYLQKQKEKLLKFQKACENRLNISRKAKTRSDIRKQAVEDRKKQLSFIENQEIKNHIENMRYKIFRHEYIKEKKQQQKLANLKTVQAKQKKMIKEKMRENLIEGYRSQYENKMRIAERNRKISSMHKNRQTEKKRQERNLRTSYAKKHQQYLGRYHQEQKIATTYYLEKEQQQAAFRREQINKEKKLKAVDKKIKQEMCTKKREYEESRKLRLLQEKVERSSQKMEEIKQIEKLKKRLTDERLKYPRQFFPRHSLQV